MAKGQNNIFEIRITYFVYFLGRKDSWWSGKIANLFALFQYIQ